MSDRKKKRRQRDLERKLKSGFDAAIARLTAQLDQDPTDEAARLKRAQLYSENGDYELAIQEFAKCEAEPFLALFERAWCHIRLGDYNEALRLANRGIEEDPESKVSSYLVRAIARVNLGTNTQRQLAVEDLEQALAIDPECVQALIIKGDTLESLDRNEEAIEAFDAAIALAPWYSEAWAGRSSCYHNLGNEEQGQSDYAQAVRLDPDNYS